MVLTLELLGTSNPGDIPNLLLRSEQEVCLFDANGGTQRYALDRRIKIAKVTNCFVSRVHPQTIAGIPGLLLTRYILGNKPIEPPDSTINIYGPPPLRTACHALLGRYTWIKDNVTIEEITEETTLHLNGINVTAYPIGEYPTTRRDGNNPLIEWPESYAETETMPSCDSVVVLYVLTVPQFPGRLDAAILKRMNIKPGRIYQELKEKESVTLPDGRVVKNEDVCSPPIQGTSFVLVPSVQATGVEALVEVLRKLPIKDGTQLLHFSETSVCGSELYRQCVEEMAKSTLHYWCNVGADCRNTRIREQAQAHLRWAAAQVTPGLMASLKPGMRFEDTLQRERAILSWEKGQFAGTGSTWTCRKPTPEATGVSRLHVDANLIDEVWNVPLSHMEPIVKNSSVRDTDYTAPPQKFPILWVLGCGCAVPSKYRNVSGYLLQLNEHISIAFDYGEASTGQLYSMCRDLDEFLSIIQSVRPLWNGSPFWE